MKSSKGSRERENESAQGLHGESLMWGQGLGQARTKAMSPWAGGDSTEFTVKNVKEEGSNLVQRMK
jgi:hypothetical protein